MGKVGSVCRTSGPACDCVLLLLTITKQIASEHPLVSSYSASCTHHEHQEINACWSVTKFQAAGALFQTTLLCLLLLELPLPLLLPQECRALTTTLIVQVTNLTKGS
jgi:hypothetical protein